MPNVSEYLDFGFYDWITYRTHAGLGQQEIGRWRGVLHQVGNLMSYWILPEPGIVISCTAVQRITNIEKQTEEYKHQMNDFQITLEGKRRTTSSDLLGKYQYRPKKNVLSLEDEEK